MLVGIDQISPEQQQFLEDLRAGVAPPAIIDYFVRLIDDDGIAQGREQVHPDWISHFESKRDLLKRFANPKVLEKIHSFFEKLMPFDSSIGTWIQNRSSCRFYWVRVRLSHTHRTSQPSESCCRSFLSGRGDLTAMTSRNWLISATSARSITSRTF